MYGYGRTDTDVRTDEVTSKSLVTYYWWRL